MCMMLYKKSSAVKNKRKSRSDNPRDRSRKKKSVHGLPQLLPCEPILTTTVTVTTAVVHTTGVIVIAG